MSYLNYFDKRNLIIYFLFFNGLLLLWYTCPIFDVWINYRFGGSPITPARLLALLSFWLWYTVKYKMR